MLLATAATVIASQAVITGAYSVAAQAAHLGSLPRLRVTARFGYMERPDVPSALVLLDNTVVMGSHIEV